MGGGKSGKSSKGSKSSVGVSGGGRGVDVEGAPVVKDSRFNTLHHDPRFSRQPRHHGKIEVDERFAGVFQAEGMKKLYQADLDVDRKATTKAKKKGKSESKEAVADEGGIDDKAAEAEAKKKEYRLGFDIEARLATLNKMARGEISGSESDSVEESDEESESDWAPDTGIMALPGDVDGQAPTGDATKRIAIVNVDWSRLHAVDLLALLRSFAPTSGSVESVTVYPSNFGLEKMAEEEKHGPQGVWKSEEAGGRKKKGHQDDEDEEIAQGRKIGDLNIRDIEELDKADGTGYDPNELRKYELQKLKYYYAVAVCDSVATANAVYNQCDGMEYETTSNVMDLRFVPDDTEFENEPRESASSVPEDYKVPSFYTAALQSSNVKLTWDQEDVTRTRRLRWEMGPESNSGPKDEDLRMYLASGESSSDSEEELPEELDEKARKAELKRREREKRRKERKKYKSLFKDALDVSDDDGQKDMEITFKSGVSADMLGLSKRLEDKRDGKSETVFEATRRKQKEKRRKAKESLKTPSADAAYEEEDSDDVERAALLAKEMGVDLSDDVAGGQDAAAGDESAGDEDVLAGDDFFLSSAPKKKSSKSKSKSHGADLEGRSKSARDDEKAEKAKTKAELELLLMGSDDDDKNYDVKKLLKAEKEARKKAKKAKKRGLAVPEKESGVDVDGFKVNVADPRFAAMHTRAEYSIDPTHGSFRNTAGMNALATEAKNRRVAKTDTAPTGSTKSLEDLAASVKSGFGKRAATKKQGGSRKKSRK